MTQLFRNTEAHHRKLPVSPNRVFDASLVPETCPEFPPFASLIQDSIRQAKADIRNGASCPTVSMAPVRICIG